MTGVFLALLGLSGILGGLAIIRLQNQLTKLATRLVTLIKLTTELAEELNKTKAQLIIKKGDK